MSLYVRVMTGFWNHRKTLRLRAAMGDAALWLPIRMWCYAAENQPDGCFEQYSAEELAMLMGYLGNASCMIQALQAVGFLDGMKIHDWEEHNGFHQTFSSRAKKAADARWKGKDKKQKVIRNDKKGNEASIAPSNASSIDFSLLPECLDTEAFKATWTEYMAFRKQARQGGFTPIGLSQKWNEMKEWGPEASIKSINETIANGWKGTFYPKQRNGKQPAAQRTADDRDAARTGLRPAKITVREL